MTVVRRSWVLAVLLVSATALSLHATPPQGPALKTPALAKARKTPPPFTVKPRTPILEENGNFPCSDCHDETMPANPKERILVDEHEDLKLVHGAGRFWCTTCHLDADRDQLRSLKNEPIPFDRADLLCAQCHFQRARDFLFGAHGKRIGTWNGPRVLTPCTACHDAHDPKFKPRRPASAPILRPGLQASHEIEARSARLETKEQGLLTKIKKEDARAKKEPSNNTKKATP